MRHRSKRKILSRTASARNALVRQLAVHVILKGRITTTLTKAKVVRPFVERTITIGKTSTVTARRLLISKLANEAAARKVISEIAPKYASRPGGYTRITKLGRRQGDASPMALIELM